MGERLPGLAITDHGTISGVPEFFRTAEKYPDVKPIAGCEFWVGDKKVKVLKGNKLIDVKKSDISEKFDVSFVREYVK